MIDALGCDVNVGMNTTVLLQPLAVVVKGPFTLYFGLSAGKIFEHVFNESNPFETFCKMRRKCFFFI